MKRSGSGFTLVELLVVIGIIGLLVSILVPALNAARIAAWTVTCKSNMRTIGVGFMQYGNNNKTLLPPQAFWNTSPQWNNYTPLPTSINYYTGYLKANAATSQGPVTLMKAFGIGGLYDTGLIKEFEVFYCPGFRPARKSDDHKRYLHDTYVEPVTGAYYTDTNSADTVIKNFILSGYHYFKNNVSQTNEMGARSFVYDLIYDWTATPHASSNGKPKGLNVLHGDGHVKFETDCFDEILWGDLTGTNAAQTPGGNLDLWFPILAKMADSATEFNLLELNEKFGWNNFQCVGYERDSAIGAAAGTWTYAP